MRVEYQNYPLGCAPMADHVVSRCPVCDRHCVKREYARYNAYIHSHQIVASGIRNNRLEVSSQCRVLHTTGKITAGPKDGHYLADGEVIDAQEHKRREKAKD